MYYFIGIKGSGMAPLATILYELGNEVAGSDIDKYIFIEDELRKRNIPIYSFNKNNIKDGYHVIIGNAFDESNEEVKAALENPNVECTRYYDFLADFMEHYVSIAVAGTHGKTTTTSLVSLCFLEALRDPSIQVGAIIKELDGNYRVGTSEHFIIEACEYVESFLKFSPKAEIILNIDNDHLDYFKTFENIKNAFVKYVKLLPDDGLLVINGDDKNCLDLPQYTKCNIIKYGINNKDTNFYADNISFDNDGFPSFDVFKNNEFYCTIKLSVPGKHNILNALACTCLCDYYGIDKKSIENALSKFTGADRRFEFKGKVNGASIYDDYGHHPTEVKAVAKAMQEKKYNKSWVVFQPHTYSRTKNLLDDFANALINFDNIIVLDIYAARETNTYNISSLDLVNKIKELGKDAKYIPDFNDCVSYLKENVKENDIVMTLGAGTVTQIGPMLLNQ